MVAKGLAVAAIGVLLAMIGRDPITGASRLTFGMPGLSGGLSLIPVLIGVFAISEVVIQGAKLWRRKVDKLMDSVAEQASLLQGYDIRKDKLTWAEFKSTIKATYIGAAVGTFIGALPGAGQSLAAFMSYGLAQRFSRKPEEFGKGSLEGIASAESGNSATCDSTFIPLFAFGIPGGATAALFGAAFILMGMTPGPSLLTDNTAIIYALFLTLIFANLVNLVLGKILLPYYSRIAMIQPGYMIPAVFIPAIVGTYAANNSVVDVWVLLFAGALGVTLRLMSFSLAPLVLGFIIGPGAERALRQAMIMGRGDWTVLVTSPIAIGFYVAAFALILLFTVALRKRA
ncbi:tripartite tricarboxylate transporter permease [Halomonas sp. Y3]|uniref:tripartite tricarboxylate transporter permease n=1 Tax=Halomonas sp. Y3 TaxID=2956797 RepID=UPI00209EB76F|nr:tripartite tricarboxylate transporter permease [Halomonas sp. Y3]